MAQNISLSTELSQNIDLLHRLLPLGKSFDLITRDLRLGETPAFWLGINGFCNTEILQQIFSDLQDPHTIHWIPRSTISHSMCRAGSAMHRYR